MDGPPSANRPGRPRLLWLLLLLVRPVVAHRLKRLALAIDRRDQFGKSAFAGVGEIAGDFLMCRCPGIKAFPGRSESVDELSCSNASDVFEQWCPAHLLRPIPPGVSFEDASALGVNGPLAVAQLLAAGSTTGQTVLVQAAGSSSGSMALLVARAMGLSTIGTTRSSERARCYVTSASPTTLYVQRT